jgi:diguanylate cyclase
MLEDDDTDWDHELRALEQSPLAAGLGALARADALAQRMAQLRPGSIEQARAWIVRSRGLSAVGRHTDAMTDARHAVRLLRAGGDAPTLALALEALGNACTRDGDYPAALGVLEEAIWLARRGDAALLARARNALAVCLHEMGRYDDALALYDEARAALSVDEHRRIWMVLTGNREHALLMQAFRLLDQGDAEGARLHARRAEDTADLVLAHWREAGEPLALAGCLDNRAAAQVLAGTPERAHVLLDEAERLADTPVGGHERVYLALTRARAHLAEGDAVSAVAVLQAQLDRHAAQGLRARLDELLRVMAIAREAAGDLAGALAVFKRHHAEHARLVLAHAEERARMLAVKLQTERLVQESRQDPLTGLANRRRLDEYLAGMLPRATPRDPLTLVLIDLDEFKPINDRHGHQVGDVALRWVARHLQAQCRQTDLPARLGGDEFALALAAPVAVAERVCLRLREALARQAPELPPGLVVHFSAGVAQSDGQGGTQALIARADQALYAAKAAGRDAVRIAA